MGSTDIGIRKSEFVVRRKWLKTTHTEECIAPILIHGVALFILSPLMGQTGYER